METVMAAEEIDSKTETSHVETQNEEENLTKTTSRRKSLSSFDARTFISILPQLTASIIVSSFHVPLGVCLTFSAVLIPQLESLDSEIRITITESSWIASCIAITVPIGAIAGGVLMDNIGRLNTIKLGCLSNIIGWISIVLASNLPMLLIGRFLTGFSGTFATGAATVYVTEIARPDLRGTFISFGPIFLSLGMVLSYFEGWFSWRILAWSCIAYTVIPAVSVFFIHESPSWLINKGRVADAKKSLEWLHKYQSNDNEESYADKHLTILKKENDIKTRQKRKVEKRFIFVIRKFLKPTGYKPLLILIGLFVVQQFGGVYVVLFYAVIFFQSVGTEIDPYLAAMIIGFVRLAMSIVTSYSLKKINKRTLLMLSCSGMALSLFISGLFTKLIHDGTTSLNWIPVVFLSLYVLFSMVGVLPIPWSMSAEVFPIEIRGVAQSTAISAAHLISFAAIQTYRSLGEFFGGAHAIQFFYGAVSLLGVVYTYVLVPETSGKKLSEIEEYFNEHNSYVGKIRKDKKVEKANKGNLDLLNED